MYTSPPRQLLVLDSRFRINPEDKDHLYKFKLNARIRFNGMIKLEQFIFQNSQYVFNSEKKTDKFIYTEVGEDGNPRDPVVINLKGMFDNTDSFIKYFNETMSNNVIRIRMTYIASLYEIKIQHLDGINFSLSDYYDDGTFMGDLSFMGSSFLSLIGLKKLNQGANVYTNVNTPKIFSQRLIYIPIPELRTYSITTKGISSSSKPYTYLVLSKTGFEIVSNINNTFANEFYVKDKDIDEFSVRIHDSDGLPFVNTVLFGKFVFRFPFHFLPFRVSLFNFPSRNFFMIQFFIKINEL